ncbi:heavy metal-associated isoprenylated plant protein 1-like isoform X3 [Punica granatum]|uniref:Heavy metal-associated isoprenylated plant protein 1-like isoform X3 n=1 Tax=Punica granatum TaxID=22663 RepID=A0A6P8C8U2_PUNGR|nr:heavy metal-associated isoprenylated plant protein 1-like isoform X3 [Punica granatum]
MCIYNQNYKVDCWFSMCGVLVYPIFCNGESHLRHARHLSIPFCGNFSTCLSVDIWNFSHSTLPPSLSLSLSLSVSVACSIYIYIYIWYISPALPSLSDLSLAPRKKILIIMGEGGGEGKAAKQDEAKLGKVAAEEKKAAEDQEKKNEEKAEDDENKKGKEEKAEEEPKPPTPPPAPLILHVDLHCVGCVKKIKTFLLKTRGVEEVEVDMEQNQVKIKGVVSPQSLCDKISKKTKRRANVIHPLPSAEGDPLPELVISQVSGLATVELSVYVHCEGCAKQLQRKILKMRGGPRSKPRSSRSPNLCRSLSPRRKKRGRELGNSLKRSRRDQMKMVMIKKRRKKKVITRED